MKCIVLSVATASKIVLAELSGVHIISLCAFYVVQTSPNYLSAQFGCTLINSPFYTQLPCFQLIKTI